MEFYLLDLDIVVIIESIIYMKMQLYLCNLNSVEFEFEPQVVFHYSRYLTSIVCKGLQLSQST